MTGRPAGTVVGRVLDYTMGQGDRARVLVETRWTSTLVGRDCKAYRAVMLDDAAFGFTDHGVAADERLGTAS